MYETDTDRASDLYSRLAVPADPGMSSKQTLTHQPETADGNDTLLAPVEFPLR